VTETAKDTAATTMALRRLFYLAPVLVFLVVAGYFLWGLNPERDPRVLPSVLIDKPAPEFAAAPLAGMPVPGLSTADLRTGQVSLVNVFASWCIPCRAEHPLLMDLARSGEVAIFGLNYKNKPEEAVAWLEELGNPYTRIGTDEKGRIGIDWGVSGVPETFVIDGAGRIRYRHWGPIDKSAMEQIILPLIEELRG
jgi:cytochrome c biogenesis protein CcmG, thiol:disulfide interchange protein DsbE